MRRVIKICGYSNCKKEFFPKEGRENIQKYCSESHRKYVWKKKNWRKVLDYNNALARSKNYKPTLKICIVCKKEFLPLKYHPYQKHCSWQCRNKFSQTPEKIKIWRKNWRNNNLKKIKLADKKYKERIRFGLDKESKSGLRSLRLKLDKYTCQDCKITKQLVVHHLKYPAKTIDSLITLCRACHARRHRLTAI